MCGVRIQATSRYLICPLSRVAVVTWNVNARKPSENISPLFLINDYPDFVFVCLQEFIPLTGAASVGFGGGSESQAWEVLVIDTLNEMGMDQEYETIISERLGGILLLGFAESKARHLCLDVESKFIALGKMGLVRNKGAVAVRLDFGEKDLCLVNVHLTSGLEKNDRRNANVRAILDRVSFKKNKKIEDCSAAIFCGDTNYRISAPVQEVMQMIASSDLDSLSEHDQLRQSQRQGQVLVHWQELPLAFPPTYKFDPGVATSEYSTHKSQTPSWTDRILFKGHIATRAYQRMDFYESDHRPVVGAFEFHTTDLPLDLQSESMQTLRSIAAVLREKTPLLKKGKRDGSGSIISGSAIHAQLLAESPDLSGGLIGILGAALHRANLIEALDSKGEGSIVNEGSVRYRWIAAVSPPPRGKERSLSEWQETLLSLEQMLRMTQILKGAYGNAAFRGEELTELLIRSGAAFTDYQAKEAGEQLLQTGLITCVHPRAGEEGSMRKEGVDPTALLEVEAESELEVESELDSLSFRPSDAYRLVTKVRISRADWAASEMHDQAEAAEQAAAPEIITLDMLECEDVSDPAGGEGEGELEEGSGNLSVKALAQRYEKMQAKSVAPPPPVLRRGTLAYKQYMRQKRLSLSPHKTFTPPVLPS
jgi:hypothetical protein